MKFLQGFLLVAFVTVSVGILSLVAFEKFRQEPLPVLGSVEPFKLLSADEVEFSSADLRGKVWIANFFFTSCPGICPLVMGKLMHLRRNFAPEQVEFVSISVDPKRDDPSKLRAYSDKILLDRSAWKLLTGSKEDVDDVTSNKFKFATFDDPGVHTDKVVLIDGELQIRGYYSGTSADDIKLKAPRI
ncbi:MAG: SCO family protein [Bdellovibrionales bacterium]|nr:SCO family protein [Bdellovibrionales bacterium]